MAVSPIRSIGLLLVAVLTTAEPAFAQCRIGSGPDMGDGIPYCDPPASDAEAGATVPAGSGQWLSYSAAVAWGEGKQGISFVFVEKYFDEDAARARALSLCSAKRWKSCAIADSITDGVIVVGRQSDGKLRVQSGATAPDTVAIMMQICAEKSVRCKVEKIVDGKAEFG